MTPNLTPKEINILKDRIAPYCQYKDVGDEVLDHLVNAIEAMRERDPDIKFKVALAKAIRNYGYYNLQNMSNIAYEQLQKTYNKKLNRYYLDLWRPKHWPILIVGILVCTTKDRLFSLLNPFLAKTYMVLALLVVIILGSFHVHQWHLIYKQKTKYLQNKYFLTNQVMILFSTIQIILICNPWLYIELLPWIKFTISASLFGWILILYASFNLRKEYTRVLEPELNH